MLPFSKLVGTGNDFIFIDLTETTLKALTPLSHQQIAQKICDRHTGVGADGIIFVDKAADTTHFKWDFYNRDASTAEFCGNAARCFGRWAYHYYKRGEFSFESAIGHVKVEKLAGGPLFCVHFDNLKASALKITLQAKEFEAFKDVFEKLESVYLINSGVPHFVCSLKEDLSRSERLQIVGAFRFHKAAGLAGANVTFLFSGQTESFERGVEDFTLSCGTGVLASAIALWYNNARTEVDLRTPGGDLKIKIIKSESGSVVKADLIGPADFICEGRFSWENL
jgi:diaminopimelate epimerase